MYEYVNHIELENGVDLHWTNDLVVFATESSFLFVGLDRKHQFREFNDGTSLITTSPFW